MENKNLKEYEFAKTIWLGKKYGKDYSIKQLENMVNTLNKKIDNFGKDEEPSLNYGRAGQNREFKSFQKFNDYVVKRKKILYVLKYYYQQKNIEDVFGNELQTKDYEGAL